MGAFKDVTGPASLNVSGGRTSMFMLHCILEAHGGVLPEDVHAVFCNTGKERPETLDFVYECARRWGVYIVWLEFDPEAEFNTKIVDYHSASRKGEPFEALIRDKQMLPNPVARFCTVEMKIRRAKFFMHKIKGHDHWIAHIGLRADEMHRVGRMANQKERWETEAPLARAGLTKEDVGAFWAKQPFDLRLPNINNVTPHGNCDLCFLKSRSTITALIHENPASARWWIDMENVKLSSKPSGGVFRNNRSSYAEMAREVERQQVFDFGDETSLDCFCTD